MGGLAFRAPVLAAMFLVVALANLAMPGSSNFAGEFLILLGVFKAKAAIAVIAFAGVAMASVYTLRLFIRAMHNRVSSTAQSREMTLADGLVLVPLVLVHPRAGALPAGRAGPLRALDQVDARPAVDAGARDDAGGALMLAAAGAVAHAPHIDWAALSPIVALLGRRDTAAAGRAVPRSRRPRGRSTGARDRRAGSRRRPFDLAVGHGHER